MIVLDCESYKSAMKSLEVIYGIKTDEIKSFFNSFDLDAHCEIHDPDCMGDQELRNVFEQQIKLNPKKLDKVCWFHLTRALPDETFKEGILPLSKSLEKVWSVFYEVFRDTKHYNNIKTLKVKGVDDFQYNLKSSSIIHSGPYAMLVKEVAFDSKNIGNHDYLRMPEIMEDICNGYQKKYGSSIFEELYKSLSPIIIKFISGKKIDESCVGAALHYAYQSNKLSNMSISSNTCFDGGNLIIPFDEILNIDSVNF